MAKSSNPFAVRAGSRSSNPFAVKPLKATKKQQKITPDEMRKGNAATAERLKAVGVTYKNPNDEPGFFDHVFGVMQAPMVGAESVVNNVLSDKKVNPLEEMGKSLSGHGNEAMSGGKMLNNLGWNPDKNDTFGKFLHGAAGMALDMGLDPLTYLTFGYSHATKIGAAEKASEMFGNVLSKADALKLAEYVPSVKQYAGKVIGEELGHEAQADVFKAITRMVGHANGDAGGVKMALGYGKNKLTPSILKGSTIGDLAEKVIPGAIRESEAAKSVARAGGEIASLVTPYFKDKNELGVMGAEAGRYARTTLRNRTTKAMIEASARSLDTFKGIPKEVRDRMLIAFQRTDVKATEKAAAWKQYQAAKKEAEKAGELVTAMEEKLGSKLPKNNEFAKARLKAQTQMQTAYGEFSSLVKNEAYNHDLFKTELQKLMTEHGKPLSGDELQHASNAMERFTKEMSRVRGQELKSGIDVADRGMFYVPGMDGTPDAGVVKHLQDKAEGSYAAALASKDKAKIKAARERIVALANMRTPEKAAGVAKATGGAASDFAKAKEFSTLEGRLNAGYGALTDAQEVMAKRIEKSGKRIATNDFTETIAKKFGEPIGKANSTSHMDKAVSRGGNVITDMSGESYRIHPRIAETIRAVQGLFDSPSELKMFSENAGKLTSIWKSLAVSTPGFFLRNMQSNYFLASAHEMGNPEAWARASALVLGNVDDEAKVGFGALRDMKVGELRKHLLDHAVAGETQMEEVLSSVKGASKARKIASGGRLAEGVQHANQKVEEIGRVAVYMQAMDRGMNPRQASDLVDRVLYSYNPLDKTAAERAAGNVIPFYTWLRRNLPAQISHLVHDPSKISFFNKLKNEGDNATGSDTNWGEMPQYMRDMNPIPLPIPGGDKIFLNPNWGWQDIQKLEGLAPALHGDLRPLAEEALSNVSPFLKTGAELAFNRDSFKQTDLERFPGDLTQAPPNIQFLEHKLHGNPVWEQLKKASGAYTKEGGTVLVSPLTLKASDQNPLVSNIGRLAEPLLAMADGEQPSAKQLSRVMSILGGVKPMANEADKWHDNRAYEDQQNLRDALTLLKTKGIEAPKKKKKASSKSKAKSALAMIAAGKVK